MEEPSFSSAAPSMGARASAFLKEMMARKLNRPFISRIDHENHNTPGKTIEMKDGRIYEVQANGSWKKVREEVKGKARRKLEKAMAEVNV